MTRESAEELVDPDADGGAGATGDAALHEGWLPRPGAVGLVFVGGVLGVAARILLMLVVGDDAIAVFAANVAGALLLGVLLELVAGRPHLSALRPLLGTGVLGGFTTYSAFAVGTVLLGAASGAGYAAASLVGGLVAAGAGVALGRGLRRFAR